MTENATPNMDLYWNEALADELLFGKLVDGGTVIVDVDVDDKDKVVLTIGAPVSKSHPRTTASDQETELAV